MPKQSETCLFIVIYSLCNYQHCCKHFKHQWAGLKNITDKPGDVDRDPKKPGGVDGNVKSSFSEN